SSMKPAASARPQNESVRTQPPFPRPATDRQSKPFSRKNASRRPGHLRRPGAHFGPRKTAPRANRTRPADIHHSLGPSRRRKDHAGAHYRAYDEERIPSFQRRFGRN